MKKINCILLIDDDLAGNAFHIITIKKSGICEHIRTATNGVKALEYINNAKENSEEFPKPDLIYLDINMPGMNGFEFLVEYKMLDEKLKSKAVIIMLTTSLNPDDKEKALNHKEISEFQNKPLTVETIHRAVEKYF